MLASASALLGLAQSAAALGPAPCDNLAPFNAYKASDKKLKECHIRKIPLSAVESLPGGGHLYVYRFPDGQVVSQPDTPPGFNALTASPATDSAYDLPSAPPRSSPQYREWRQIAAHWQLTDYPQPYLLMFPVRETLEIDHPQPRPAEPLDPIQPTGPFAPLDATHPPGPYWAGYLNTGKDWERAEVTYNEPKLGPTNCPDPQVSFWDGIGGYNNANLGQDGTAAGGVPGAPLHFAWYEVLPQAMIPFTGAQPHTFVTASPGEKITAITEHNPGWKFILYVGDHPHAIGDTGGYNGSTAEEIVERAGDQHGHAPLLNFNYVIMHGYNGRGIQPISHYPHITEKMGNFATTDPLTGDGSQFQVTQHRCGG